MLYLELKTSIPTSLEGNDKRHKMGILYKADPEPDPDLQKKQTPDF